MVQLTNTTGDVTQVLITHKGGRAWRVHAGLKLRVRVVCAEGSGSERGEDEGSRQSRRLIEEAGKVSTDESDNQSPGSIRRRTGSSSGVTLTLTPSVFT